MARNMAYNTFCNELADTDTRLEDEYTIDMNAYLGGGMYGNVYKGIRNSDGQQVAIKLVNDSKAKCLQIGGQLQPVESTLLAKLAHIPGVIGYHGWFKANNEIAIVMDYHESAISIEEYMEKNTFSENEAKVYFKMIVEAVEACHTAGIIHGDINAKNVLIDVTHNRIYLIDFGNGFQLVDLPEIDDLRDTFVGLSKVLKALVESVHDDDDDDDDEHDDDDDDEREFSFFYRDLFLTCRAGTTFAEVLNDRWFD